MVVCSQRVVNGSALLFGADVLTLSLEYCHNRVVSRVFVVGSGNSCEAVLSQIYTDRLQELLEMQ